MVEGSSSCKLTGFVGTQMLPIFPNGQMGLWPGKTQHHSHVMDLGRQARVILRKNSDLCIFPIHSLAIQKKLLVIVWSSFMLWNVVYVNFGVPLEGSKRINISLYSFWRMLVGRYLKIEVHVNIDLFYTYLYLTHFKIYIYVYTHTYTYMKSETERKSN